MPALLKRVPFPAQVLAGLVLGVALGLVARSMGTVADGSPNWLTSTLDTIGSSFVGLLKTTVVPLVVTAIIASIANLRGVTNAARLGRRRAGDGGVRARLQQQPQADADGDGDEGRDGEPQQRLAGEAGRVGDRTEVRDRRDDRGEDERDHGRAEHLDEQVPDRVEGRREPVGVAVGPDRAHRAGDEPEGDAEDEGQEDLGAEPDPAECCAHALCLSSCGDDGGVRRARRARGPDPTTGVPPGPFPTCDPVPRGRGWCDDQHDDESTAGGTA